MLGYEAPHAATTLGHVSQPIFFVPEKMTTLDEILVTHILFFFSPYKRRKELFNFPEIFLIMCLADWPRPDNFPLCGLVMVCVFPQHLFLYFPSHNPLKSPFLHWGRELTHAPIFYYKSLYLLTFFNKEMRFLILLREFLYI